MIKAVILGYGNVGSHIATAFLKNKSIDLVQVFNRNIDKIQHLKNKLNITNNSNELLDADLYIIAISDDAISEFSKSLNLSDKLVIHTSGSVKMNALNSNRCGVFYPLQTFSKNKEVGFKQIPICIEANNDKDLVLLETLASSISDKVYLLDSEKRMKMHLSAVFVNNFVNHLYYLGSEICKENEVSFEILKPLILETAEKIKTLSPLDAQTGPAKRNDLLTIEKQLKVLSENETIIYKNLTQSIIKTYTT